MNATSYYWSYIDFYTLITYTSYITYTHNYTACIYSWLQDMFFIFTDNFFSITQLKQ